MRKLGYAASLACALCVLAAVFLSSFDMAAFLDIDYYGYEFEKNGSDNTTGFDSYRLENEAELLIDYMKLPDTGTLKRFETSDFFNDREKIHMRDVRTIVRSAVTVRRAALAAGFVLAVMLLIIGTDRRVIAGAFSVVFGTAIGMFILLSVVTAIDFDRAFVIFHKLFFNNDFWLFDPAESRLINMVPERFFVDTSFRVCVIFLTISAAIFIYSHLAHRADRHLKRG
ncbi:TIGR01906 family membrane protein [Lachnospiraceae bacterium NSJ-143]|nr:TIGR01906 family membrane protein [Lachnospiraceae bacterium NSJ-143]